jgi:hypothetical protein
MGRTSRPARLALALFLGVCLALAIPTFAQDDSEPPADTDAPRGANPVKARSLVLSNSGLPPPATRGSLAWGCFLIVLVLYSCLLRSPTPCCNEWYAGFEHSWHRAPDGDAGMQCCRQIRSRPRKQLRRLSLLPLQSLVLQSRRRPTESRRYDSPSRAA